MRGTGRKIIKRIRAYGSAVLCNSLASSNLCPRHFRIWFYRLTGNKILTRSISSHCFVGGGKLEIAKGCYVGPECFFDATERICIEENVFLAPRCSLITGTHAIGSSEKRASDVPNQAKPISIGKGTWIGTNAVILAGVTIGQGCVIGAGALVNKDCEDNFLYAGVPARKIRKLDAVDYKIVNQETDKIRVALPTE